VVAGFLANVAYDAVTGALASWFGTTVEDRIETAAESVAEDYNALIADDLLEILGSDRLGDTVESFKTEGEPIAVDQLATVFREERNVIKFLDRDAEPVVEDFLNTIEREIAADDELWRRLNLQYIKAERRDTDVVLEAIMRIESNVSGIAAAIEPEPVREAVDTLRSQGFEWLDTKDFEDGQAHELHCWRRAFTLTEVRQGYAIDRQRPIEDGDHGERVDVTDEIFEKVTDGGGAVVVGSPGAGKTTVCRTVLSRWDANPDRGPVLYRRRGSGEPIDNVGELASAIETVTDEGSVLVAVEDATRSGSLPVFETIHDYADDDAVSFLLTSREYEWDAFRDRLRRGKIDEHSQLGEEVQTIRDEYLDPVWIPGLDPREVERICDHFEYVTDRSVDLDREMLYEHIRTQNGFSPLLLLAYWLPIIDDIDRDLSAAGPTALERTVSNAYDRVANPARGEAADAGDLVVNSDREAELLSQVALLVNLLNAAGWDVSRAILHSLAAEPGEHAMLDRLVANFEGVLVVGREGDRYLTNHSLWSVLYLEEFLERAASDPAARQRFEACLNRVFSMFDEPDTRGEISDYLGLSSDLLARIEANPAAVSNAFVDDLFSVGVDRPRLAPLFGTSEHSGITLPEACDEWVAVDCAFHRAKMYQKRGDRELERAELDAAKDAADETLTPLPRFGVIYAVHQGHFAEQQGEYATARRYFMSALQQAAAAGTEVDEAVCRSALGIVASKQGDYEKAIEHFRASRDISKDLEKPRGEAATLHNLGAVFAEKREFDTAVDYFEQSRTLYQAAGDRSGEAKILNNLGMVAGSQGDLETAREYVEQGLALTREIGNRSGEASSLQNLGMIANTTDDIERARERFEESLELARSINDRKREAKTLHNFGTLALKEGDYAVARKRLQKSLSIHQDIGARPGIAGNHTNLGRVARESGALHEASAHYERAVEIYEDIGVRRDAITPLHGLIVTAINREEYDAAATASERALIMLDEASFDDQGRYRQMFQLFDAALIEGDTTVIVAYISALDAIGNSLPADAAACFAAVWDHRIQFSPDEPEYAEVLAAGVQLVALFDLGDVNESSGVWKSVIDMINTATADLPVAVCPTFEMLDGNDPSLTPDEVRDLPADLEGDDLTTTLVKKQADAAADILAALTDSETTLEEAAGTPSCRKTLRSLAGDTPAVEVLAEQLWNPEDKSDEFQRWTN